MSGLFVLEAMINNYQERHVIDVTSQDELQHNENEAERLPCLKVSVFGRRASVPVDALQQRAAVATHKHTNYV